MTEYEAGAEIDALVAERIMVAEQITGWESLPIPPFSTDIADAWQVMEWMVGEGWLAGVEFRHGVWRCEVERLDRDESVVMVSAETAPLAICRTALKAIDL